MNTLICGLNYLLFLSFKILFVCLVYVTAVKILDSILFAIMLITPFQNQSQNKRPKDIYGDVVFICYREYEIMLQAVDDVVVKVKKRKRCVDLNYCPFISKQSKILSIRNKFTNTFINEITFEGITFKTSHYLNEPVTVYLNRRAAAYHNTDKRIFKKGPFVDKVYTNTGRLRRVEYYYDGFLRRIVQYKQDPMSTKLFKYKDFELDSSGAKHGSFKIFKGVNKLKKEIQFDHGIEKNKI
jgi:hypothetical protein